MPFTQGHALLIGVGSYQHSPFHHVPLTAADAQAVAGIVQDAQFCGYPADQVTVLSDAEASRDAILAALDRLAQTQKDDTVLFFYSGHGDYDTSSNYTLTASDTRWYGEQIVPGSGISQAELLEKICTIPAERVLLLFNACHAGHLSPTLGAAVPPAGKALPNQTANALLATGSGRIIITACREQQVAFVGTGDCTLFARALVDGLRGEGDVYSRHGFISVFDLYTHLYYALDEAVQQVVPQQFRDSYGSKQEPELTILKGVGPFAVALYHGASRPGDFPTDQTLDAQTAVREVNDTRSRRAFENIIGTATVQGDNYGQNVGVNYGTMTQSNQTIQNDAPNQGAQGTFHAPVTFNQPRTTFNQQGQHVQGDQYNAGRDIVHSEGDITQAGGDYVGGSKMSGTISTGNVRGSGIAIGHGAQSSVRTISTGGGDYAEGNIDKRTFVENDQDAVSGTLRSTLLNIQATLSSMHQNIAMATHDDPATKMQLQALLDQLSSEVQQVPAEHASVAEVLVETTRQAVEQATQAHPNQMLLQIRGEVLQQMARSLDTVRPALPSLARQIVDGLQRLAGA